MTCPVAPLVVSSSSPLCGLPWPEADLPRARRYTAGRVSIIEVEPGYKDNGVVPQGRHLTRLPRKPLGPRSPGCSGSLSEMDITGNSNCPQGYLGLEAVNGLAPFVQMGRHFLRDITFRLFLCLSYGGGWGGGVWLGGEE